MKKKTLKINISKLSIGGMERAFLNFLNMSDVVRESETIVLIGYVTDPNLLKQIPKNVRYRVISKKWGLIGKLHVACYLVILSVKTFFKRNQYDCAISYSCFHGSFSRITRHESKNSIVFVHANLLESYKKDALKSLIRRVKFEKFAKVICVSENAMKAFKKLFPRYSGRAYVINNFINYREIINKSREPIDFKKKTVTFLNVCRHEKDTNKKVSRILKAVKKLKDDIGSFEVILIGEGKEDEGYLEYIRKNQLSDYVKMLGAKTNPFPYYLQSDAIIVSSAYEGYGLVLDEARVLGVPVISTKVGDAGMILDEHVDVLCENSENGVYYGMKEFLKKPIRRNKVFSAKTFNEKINKQLDEVIFNE